MSGNVANNFNAGDWHATDLSGVRVVVKTTNLAGVHTLHTLVDGATPGACSKVAVGATSAQSAAITGAMVRLTPSTNCHVAFGVSPTAAADGSCMYLPAGVPTVLAFTSGNKIAVIQDSAAGNLFITVMS